MGLNNYEVQDVIEKLQKGEMLPDDYKYKLFPTKQKEYELVYGGKMRKEDILANEDGVFPVPLQVDKVYNGAREAFADGWHNMIVFGDNLQFLKTVYQNEDPLIKGRVKGKVKLIYIDPPFGTGDEYDGNKGQKGYSAKTKGAEFVEFLRRRVIVAKEILADEGCIFVRLDYHFGHYVKVLMDDIFGKENFRNEIVINREKRLLRRLTRFNHATESIFFYTKSSEYYFKDVVTPRKCNYCGQAKQPRWEDLTSPGLRNPPERTIFGNIYLPRRGRHFTYTQVKIDEFDTQGRLRINPEINYFDLNGDKIEGRPEYLQTEETPIDTNWTDIKGYSYSQDYPTENSQELLERIILCCTKEGDLVMDFFSGSGTTVAVAEKLGRKWIACDIGKLAHYTIQKRIYNIGDSKSLENAKKKYKKKARCFITVNTGKYDLEKVINLEQRQYKDFVLNLFEADMVEQKIKGFKIDGCRKDGGYCHVFPYWEHKNTSIDEQYIENIHAIIGEQAGDSFYIIAPATKVAMFEDYFDIGETRYYLLKVPYHVINELHKEKFKSFRQPQSKNGVNALDAAVGFHFMHQPKVKSTLTINENDVCIKITEFKSEFVDEVTDAPLDNFQSFAMVIVDLDFDGKCFAMDQAYFAEDLLPKKRKKKNVAGDEDNSDVTAEIKAVLELSLPPLKKADCGDKIALVYVDIFGNEFKETLTVN